MMWKTSDISKQNIYNSQKTNVDISWIEVSVKKRKQNSPETLMPRKQPKMNSYQLNKTMPITNSIEEFEKELDDENNNTQGRKDS